MCTHVHVVLDGMHMFQICKFFLQNSGRPAVLFVCILSVRFKSV